VVPSGKNFRFLLGPNYMGSLLTSYIREYMPIGTAIQTKLDGTTIASRHSMTGFPNACFVLHAALTSSAISCSFACPLTLKISVSHIRSLALSHDRVVNSAYLRSGLLSTDFPENKLFKAAIAGRPRGTGE